MRLQTSALFIEQWFPEPKLISGAFIAIISQSKMKPGILLKLLLARLCVAVISLGCLATARAQVDISNNLETFRTNRHMPGLMAMCVKQGRIMAQGAAGYRRQGQSDKLLLTDRINLGSNTKWMTATIAGRLVDRGIISWNTRVRDVFTNYSSFNPAFPDATLDQLLAHRAGVQSGTTFENNHWGQLLAQTGTIPQIRRWVSETVLTDPPQVA